MERARQWAVRCVHETQLHLDNSFITLTYNDEHLPQGSTLVLEDLQKFFKRLRKSLGKKKIRYFACGEYGDDNNRPHYHAIIFGHDFADKTQIPGQDPPQYISQNLESVWGKGFCQTTSVSFDAAAYVARYSLKKINGQLAKAHYESVCPTTGEIHDRTPEFIVMSRQNGGIGKAWLDRFKTDVYPEDFVVQKGRKLSVPRFYDKQLPENELQEYKLRRKTRALANSKNNTAARLKVRKAVLVSKLSLTQRKL